MGTTCAPALPPAVSGDVVASPGQFPSVAPPCWCWQCCWESTMMPSEAAAATNPHPSHQLLAQHTHPSGQTGLACSQGCLCGNHPKAPSQALPRAPGNAETSGHLPANLFCWNQVNPILLHTCHSPGPWEAHTITPELFSSPSIPKGLGQGWGGWSYPRDLQMLH
jgi:hypothetical protein